MTVYIIDNLTFYYPQTKIPALSGINLTVRKGEFLGITGPTGAGKSTLVKCLNGIIPHYQKGSLQGSVLLNGKPVQQDTIANIARRVGSVFDDPEAQIISADVEQEIIFSLENMGIDPSEMKSRIDWALQKTGLSAVRHSSTNALSGGQKQRLAIAAVLAIKPQVLVLDEPTSELDPLGTREIFEILAELNQREGITVVIIEQKTEYLARYASRIVILDQGKVAVDGPPRDVFSHSERLWHLGVQPPQIAQLAHRFGQWQQLPITVSEGLSYIQSLRSGISEQKRNY